MLKAAYRRGRANRGVCGETTCRCTFSLGFDVTLIADAYSTWDNDALIADQIIAHTNQTLAGWLVQPVPTRAVRFAPPANAAAAAASSAGPAPR